MITVLTPTGTLGYGFDSDALHRAMRLRPQVIAVDAGSTDPGPAYLGSAKPLCSRRVVKGEIAELLVAAREAGIPLVIGSAGGSGRGELVDWTVEIVREIARDRNLQFRLAWIYADIARERVERALARGEVEDPVCRVKLEGEGLAIKVTLLRLRAQCAAGETDVYGCQQHVPLMTLPVPLGGNYSPADDGGAVQS